MSCFLDTYIIAEAGVNHNGSLDMALQLIDAAAESGADAIKFQTFKTDKLVCQNTPKADYQTKTTETSESQYQMIKRFELDEDDHWVLIEHCKRHNIHFISTPFDIESVGLLADSLDLPSIKLASGEITNAPLLLKVAQTGKQVILSTGMSTLGEIEMALGVLAFGYTFNQNKPSKKAFLRAFFTQEGQQILKEKVVLLQCTTEYPAPFSDVNLRTMDTLQAAFNLPVGLSDHTPGIAIPTAAVARGAVVVEKHLTLDRNLPGPDHKASLEPDVFKAMVESIRQVEKALGSPQKRPAISEIKNINAARKSLVAAKNIKHGELFTEDNLTVKRPGSGISPIYYWNLLGKVSTKDYCQDEVIVDE